MAPASGILRDWSPNHAPDSDHKVEGTMETPVVATLVETIPRIYRQGNVLFQSAYDQFGQHFTQSSRTICGPSDRILRTIPSSRSGFVIEDVDDTGEYQFIDGELVQIVSVGDKYDEDDFYDQAFHNRPGPGRRLRNLLSRRGAKGKEYNRGGARERKGSRDKKYKGRKSKNYRNTPNNFPIPANGNDNNRFSPIDIRLPLETLCTKPDQPKERIHARGSAPFSQKMSRAATNAMNEINIYSDCEVSDLGTDIERDPLSLSHVNSDTDIDFASSFEDSLTSPPSKEEDASAHSRKLSFNNIIQEAKNLLETEIDESEFENDTDTEVVVNGRWTPAKAKSLPNINGSRKRYVQEATKRVNVDHRVQEYESRLKHVQKLYVSKPLTPPRKARPRTSEESDKGSPPSVSSPPQVAFKHLSSHSPTRVRKVAIPRRRSRETYNNTLKVLFVGSPNSGKTSLINALVKKNKKPRKSRKSVDLNIETWSPAPINGDRQTKFNLWDLPGGNVESGAHHATQSLFFSSNSLYVVVWDMSLNSSSIEDQLSPDYSYESDYDSDYEIEMMNEKRDNLIERDIDEQVMYWIDIISRGDLSNCAILPVVTFTDVLSSDEVDRRCSILMQRLLKIEHDRKHGSNAPQLVFNAEGHIPKLSSLSDSGINELQNCLLDIGSSRCNAQQPAFKHHFESKLCAVTVAVQEILNKLRDEGSKVILFQDLLVKITEDPPDVENFSQQLILNALYFLNSIGSIIYHGTLKTKCTRPHYLEDFIILSPKWLSAALSLTLRVSPDSALSKMRLNSKSRAIGIEKFNQSLPILSSSETVEIWGHIDYIRVIGKDISEDGPTNFYIFLQQLCEQCGIFVPFTVSSETKKKGRRISTTKKETFYLVPMLAEQVPAELWSYKVKENWKTTLCNSYILPDKIPCNFMDEIAACVVKDLVELAYSDSAIKIQQIMYWKTAMYMKIAEEFVEAGQRHAYFSEVFLHLIENDSPLSVNSKNQSPTGRKLIVSAKGNEGSWGEKIWKLGYGTVLDSVDSVTNRLFGEDSLKREIVCPNCLLKAKTSEATVWDRCEIAYNDEFIKCPNGHEPHPRLLLGPYEDDDCASVATGINSVFTAHSAVSAFSGYTNNSTCSYIHADVILPAIVLVALWDREENRIIKIGSGFIADNKKGLIVTASHILYNYDGETINDTEKPRIDEKFFGLKNATAIIGTHQSNESAIFTYCADVVASDVYNVDGCVLQIMTRFERPFELDRNSLTGRSDYPITSRVKQERLQRLVMTKDFQREEEVRVIGFRQTGEGILVGGAHVNRTACVNKGYICRPIDVRDEISERKAFVPRSEIVVNCATGGGNSGGPFINESGEVVGILSRADPVETQRCYLTPSVELKILLKAARIKYKEEMYPPAFNEMVDQF